MIRLIAIVDGAMLVAAVVIFGGQKIRCNRFAERSVAGYVDHLQQKGMTVTEGEVEMVRGATYRACVMR